MFSELHWNYLLFVSISYCMFRHMEVIVENSCELVIGSIFTPLKYALTKGLEI